VLTASPTFAVEEDIYTNDGVEDATVLMASLALAMGENNKVDAKTEAVQVTPSTQPGLSLAERNRAKHAKRQRAKLAERNHARRAERNRATRVARKRALPACEPLNLTEEEFNMIRITAEEGDASAQNKLGNIYRSGARFTQGKVEESQFELTMRIVY